MPGIVLNTEIKEKTKQIEVHTFIKLYCGWKKTDKNKINKIIDKNIDTDIDTKRAIAIELSAKEKKKMKPGRGIRCLGQR